MKYDKPIKKQNNGAYNSKLQLGISRSNETMPCKEKKKKKTEYGVESHQICNKERNRNVPENQKKKKKREDLTEK